MLSSHEHQAEHVVDVGLLDASDISIWQYAVDHDAVLITKDEDFARYLRQATTSPVVLWVRIGNTSSRVLLAWFEPLLGEIEMLISQGERLIELR